MADIARLANVPAFTRENGFYTSAAKSKAMSRIRQTGNDAERTMRKLLWGLGIRYRKNDPKLPGKPDISIYKYKIAIFIDGEFWHGYEWPERQARIKTNRNYWIPKIQNNVARDQRNNMMLREAGWLVLRFWETQVKNELALCLKKILHYVEQHDSIGYFCEGLNVRHGSSSVENFLVTEA